MPKLNPNSDTQAVITEQGTLKRKGAGATEQSGENVISFTVDDGKTWTLKAVEWSSSSLSVASVDRMTVRVLADGSNDIDIYNDTASVPSDAKYVKLFGDQNITLPPGAVIEVTVTVTSYSSGSLSAFLLIMENDI